MGSCHLRPLKDCACVSGLHPSRQSFFTWLIPIQGMFVTFMISSVTYIRQSGILLLNLLTYTLSRDFVMLVASLVTYICQGKILLLSLLTYTLSKDFVIFVASSVTYIYQGGILLLNLLTYTLSRDFFMFVALWVTYIRQGGILLLSHFWLLWVTPFKGSCRFYVFVSNLHPSRWNLVT